MPEITHGGLSIQQVTDIQKALLVALRKRDTFWDKFCSHTSVANGYDKLSWRKLDVNALTQADIKNLAEGVTPAGLSISYKKYEVSPVNFGSWIGYTDESKKYNFDDVVADAKLVLGQRAFEEVEMRKAYQFICGTVTMDLTTDTGTNDGFLKDLLKARTILKKNHAKPISGSKYGCILTPEQAADVLVKYKNSITHTSEKEAVIDGYIGELGGFIMFENADPTMYKAAGSGQNAKGYCLFVGKTDYGMPVQTVSFGNSSIEVYNNELGKATSVDAEGHVVADTLHQHGSVGYKVMGFAARILAEEALIRAEFDLGSDGEVKLAAADNAADVAVENTGLIRNDKKVA